MKLVHKRRLHFLICKNQRQRYDQKLQHRGIKYSEKGKSCGGAKSLILVMVLGI